MSYIAVGELLTRMALSPLCQASLFVKQYEEAMPLRSVCAEYSFPNEISARQCARLWMIDAMERVAESSLPARGWRFLEFPSLRTLPNRVLESFRGDGSQLQEEARRKATHWKAQLQSNDPRFPDCVAFYDTGPSNAVTIRWQASVSGRSCLTYLARVSATVHRDLPNEAYADFVTSGILRFLSLPQVIDASEMIT